jgi:glycosyltransferase involved in cell wall biosynthesis
MRILHLSADYPDPLAPDKTRAIRNLLALASDHEHRVWSLNRVDWRARTAALDFGDEAGRRHRAVAYGAPPKGLLLRQRMARLADWIAADAVRDGWRPDAIHAHKLSVEGLAGLRLAAHLDVPLIVSSQGDSDLKIIGARPDLRTLWRRAWREAVHVLPFAPWTATRLAALLGPRDGPTTPLACPIGAPATPTPPRRVGPRFAAVFHLAAHRRKNARLLIDAVALAARATPDIRLDVIGGGDASAFAALAAHATRRAPGRVRFLGPLSREAVFAELGGACAMALPSLRESFGMAFAEALFAGAPCLVPKGWGIDGWLPDGVATVSADATDVAAVAAALSRLAAEEDGFKSRLHDLQRSGGLAPFGDRAIAATYARALESAAGAAFTASRPAV